MGDETSTTTAGASEEETEETEDETSTTTKPCSEWDGQFMCAYRCSNFYFQCDNGVAVRQSNADGTVCQDKDNVQVMLSRCEREETEEETSTTTAGASEEETEDETSTTTARTSEK